MSTHVPDFDELLGATVESDSKGDTKSQSSGNMRLPESISLCTGTQETVLSSNVSHVSGGNEKENCDDNLCDDNLDINLHYGYPTNKERKNTNESQMLGNHIHLVNTHNNQGNLNLGQYRNDKFSESKITSSGIENSKENLTAHLVREWSPNGENKNTKKLGPGLTNSYDLKSVNSKYQPIPGSSHNVYRYMKRFKNHEDWMDILKALDDGLVNRDIMQMKFLCFDIIPGSELETITRGFLMFDYLSQKGSIKYNNFCLLSELMFRIGRIDLLKLLVTDVAKYKLAVEKTDSSVSKYRVLLHEVAEDTVEKDLQTMKFFVGHNFKKAKLDTIKEPQDLFIMMEKKQLIGPNILDMLIKMMEQAQRFDMRQKIFIYRGDCYEGNPMPLSQWKETRNYLLPQETYSKNDEGNRKIKNHSYQYKLHGPIDNHSYETPTVAFPACNETITDIDPMQMTRLGINQGLNSDFVNPTTHLINGADYTQVPQKLPEYEMSSDPRGICVIINNKTFKKTMLKPREGSDIDRDNLQLIFTKLKFIVHCYDDVNGVDMVKLINQFAHNVDHTNYDCFVCCILTHGKQDKLFGSDGELVDITEFTNCFKTIQCSSLRGKPKLFFIQACQGKIRQHGYSAKSDLETDGSERCVSMESIPNEADFLVALATVPGFVSYRSKTHGSWFINALVDNLHQFHGQEDVLGILIKVNHAVSQMDAQMDETKPFKQVPQPKVTLRKKIYFR